MKARRRRAAVLVGLALILGGLAASDVAQRERALDARLAPLVPVVVAARDVDAKRVLRAEDLAVREIPQRYAPASVAAAIPEDLIGRRLAQPVAEGTFLSDGMLRAPDLGPRAPLVGRGERAAFVVGAGSTATVAPGSRVDIVITRGGGGEGEGGGRSVLALEDVEVLAVAPAGAGGAAEDEGVPRVGATLRVTLRQAVYLAAAQDFARRIRFLPRARGDRRRGGRLSTGADLS